MQKNRATEPRNRLQLQRMLMTVMIGAGLMAGCGDDTEQTSPLAPSTLATTASSDPAATLANGNVGYTGDATPGSLTTAPDINTVNNGLVDEREGPSGPTELDIELPPGITLADGQRLASERNALVRMADGRARRTQRPTGVRLYEHSGQARTGRRDGCRHRTA